MCGRIGKAAAGFVMRLGLGERWGDEGRIGDLEGGDGKELLSLNGTDIGVCDGLGLAGKPCDGGGGGRGIGDGAEGFVMDFKDSLYPAT